MKNGHDLVLEAEKSCVKVKSFSFMNTTADVFHTVYFNSQSISNDVISRCRWGVCSSQNLRVLFKTLHVQLVKWWSPDSQPTLPFKAHVDSQLFCKKKKREREKVLVARQHLGSSGVPAVCTGRKLTHEERVWIKMSTLLSREMMAQHLSWKGLRVKYRIIIVKYRTMLFESACFARAPCYPQNADPFYVKWN